MEKDTIGLPDCDELFERYFKPWHDGQSFARRGYTATRPDAEGWCGAGVPGVEASPLTEESQASIAAQIDAISEAAKADWPNYLEVRGDPDLTWIDKFDQYYGRPEVAALIKTSDPEDFSNDYLVTCCEFGAIIGIVMRSLSQELQWLYDWPYWESGLLDPNTGYRINVFHWAIKKLSDYGIEDGYRAKVLACMDSVKKGWND